ncbi:hypothetical protein ACHWQZ_G004091 [Mnemiopsis leidyi]
MLEQLKIRDLKGQYYYSIIETWKKEHYTHLIVEWVGYNYLPSKVKKAMVVNNCDKKDPPQKNQYSTTSVYSKITQQPTPQSPQDLEHVLNESGDTADHPAYITLTPVSAHIPADSSRTVSQFLVTKQILSSALLGEQHWSDTFYDCDMAHSVLIDVNIIDDEEEDSKETTSLAPKRNTPTEESISDNFVLFEVYPKAHTSIPTQDLEHVLNKRGDTADHPADITLTPVSAHIPADSSHTGRTRTLRSSPIEKPRFNPEATYLDIKQPVDNPILSSLFSHCNHNRIPLLFSSDTNTRHMRKTHQLQRNYPSQPHIATPYT